MMLGGKETSREAPNIQLEIIKKLRVLLLQELGIMNLIKKKKNDQDLE